MSRSTMYHGGVPGLRPGDLIEPGHQRKQHEGCPICEARTAGQSTIDPQTQHPEDVYATTNRLYGKFHASLYGRGDLYRVEPVGEVWASNEDSIESYRAAAFRVVSVLERAVLLTNSERRRLKREWEEADRARFTPEEMMKQKVNE